MLTPGILLLLLPLLLTPAGLPGLAKQAAPSSSSRKKKLPSLHGTECGQHRDPGGGLREPRTEPDMAGSGCRPASLLGGSRCYRLSSQPYVKLISGGNITPRRPTLSPTTFSFLCLWSFFPPPKTPWEKLFLLLAGFVPSC